MNVFDHHDYKVNRLYMSAYGMWPYNHSKIGNFYRCFVLLFILSVMVPQILKLLLSEFDVVLFAHVISSVATCFGILLKYSIYWVNRKLVKDLLDEIQESWDTVTIKDEADILRKYAKRGKKFGLTLISLTINAIDKRMWPVNNDLFLATLMIAHFGFFSISFIQIFRNVVSPLNETGPVTLPFVADYLVDERKYFYPILLHMEIVSAFTLHLLIATDMMYSTIIFHACANFSIVGYQLKHMFDDCSRKRWDNKNNLTSLQWFVRAVRSHRKALKYAELVNSCYGFSYVFQQAFSVILFVITFFGLHLALLAREVSNAIMFACHFSGGVILVFLNIVPAQALIDHSDDIFQQVYNGSWYSAPVKLQRLMLLIMRRSMNPCKISAFNFGESSYKLFSVILQTSLSYFAVLSSLQ